MTTLSRAAACALLLLRWAAPAPKASLVVVEKLSGNVGFLDATGKTLAQVKVGAHPHEMAFSADGRYLYVSDNGVVWMTYAGQGENTVSIVDLKEQKKAGVIDLGSYRRPHGIDVDPKTGNVLVTTELPSALVIVDPRTRKIIKYYDVHGEAPHMVRLGPDGRYAYVSNTSTGTLAIIDLETGSTKSVRVGDRPQGAAFSPDFKRIYVTNLGSDSITVVDTARQEKIGEIHTGKGPVRVAVTPDGKTLVYALQPAQAVGFANAQTLKEEAVVSLPGPLVSLTLSADHKFAYSSVQEQDKVFVISIADRKIAGIMQLPKGSGPDPVMPLP